MRFCLALLLSFFALDSVIAQPCQCGPIEDIQILPESPSFSDVVSVRAAIQDFSIVDEDAAVVDVDLSARVVNLTVVTTDTGGDDVDQVHVYPIGQLPPGHWTFNLLIAGLNPPPTEPPGPWQPFTTSFVVTGEPAVPVPALGPVAFFLLLSGVLGTGARSIYGVSSAKTLG